MRKGKGKTADALREAAAGGAKVEWVDRDEGYVPPETKQKTLFGKTLKEKPKARQMELELALVGLGSVAALFFGSLWYASRESNEPLAFPLSGLEKDSPADRVPYGHTLPGTKQIRIADTNSMDPVIDAGNVALGQPVKSPQELVNGDIITFHDGKDLIIHRVINQGVDELGWWGQTKGDNNDAPDDPIRFEQVDSVIVGVLY